MTILSIETSCDETAVSILKCEGNAIILLGNALASQVDLHAQYGGVFPALAKRAHAQKIIPLLIEALSSAGMLAPKQQKINEETKEIISNLCKHEEGLAEAVIYFAETYATPPIDHIAVTAGPGLEPALWVGINAARALGIVWNKPVHSINHMEGHILSAVFEQNTEKQFSLHDFSYPALALLVSGGHTELVLIQSPLHYKKIGQTRDDAVGEAFDKVARILGLPYPGGPKISLLAREAREKLVPLFTALPRPMLHSGDYDFSFSGLKTAVLYATQNRTLTDTEKKSIAREFEDAAIEVLVKKTARAINEYNVQTLIVGGGVAANTHLREQLSSHVSIPTLFPTKELSTDNSVMIGMASYYRNLYHAKDGEKELKANGNRSIEDETA